jgi:hypothetical protein
LTKRGLARKIRRLGPIAQLGERRVRNAEVEGSIPFRSTKNISEAVQSRPVSPVNLRLPAFFASVVVRSDRLRSGGHGGINVGRSALLAKYPQMSLAGISVRNAKAADKPGHSAINDLGNSAARTGRGASQPVVDGRPGRIGWRRFDEDQVGAGMIERPQMRIKVMSVARRRGCRAYPHRVCNGW